MIYGQCKNQEKHWQYYHAFFMVYLQYRYVKDVFEIRQHGELVMYL